MLRVLFLIRVPLHNISAANRSLPSRDIAQRRMKSETARSVAINFRNFIYLVSSQLCLAEDQQEEKGDLKGSQSFGVPPPSNECETDAKMLDNKYVDLFEHEQAYFLLLLNSCNQCWTPILEICEYGCHGQH